MHNHNQDAYAWAREQAAQLERLKPAALDWPNIAEELMAAAISLEGALRSQLRRLLIHLLKWRYQPEKRGGSWETSVLLARDEISALLGRSPSLKAYQDEAFRIAYRQARIKAGGQMQLSKREWEALLPAVCEWTLEQVLDADFWPEAAK